MQFCTTIEIAPLERDAFTAEDLGRIQLGVRERYGLDVDLREYLRGAGLLYVHDVGFFRAAWPIALVARELGARIHYRDVPYSDEEIRRNASASDARNRPLLYVVTIADGPERVFAIAHELRSGRGDEFDAPNLLRGFGAEIVPALASLLTDDDLAVQYFATKALKERRRAAAAALPALEALLGKSHIVAPELAVDVLAALGRSAEPALVLALDHDGPARDGALKALASLHTYTSSTRAKIESLQDADPDLVAHALGKSEIAMELGALHARHGDIEVPRDLDAWARAIPAGHVPEVVAAALEARSLHMRARAGALARATAAAIRAGADYARVREIEDEHDSSNIPWPDSSFNATMRSALEYREGLVDLVHALTNPGDLFLLLARSG